MNSNFSSVLSKWYHLHSSKSVKTLKDEDEVIVKITPLKHVVELYRNNIQIQTVNKNSTVIELSLKDAQKQKAQVLLNKLVSQYNKNALEDKNLVARNTNEFIKNRLEIINENLLIVESDG